MNRQCVIMFWCHSESSLTSLVELERSVGHRCARYRGSDLSWGREGGVDRRAVNGPIDWPLVHDGRRMSELLSRSRRNVPCWWRPSNATVPSSYARIEAPIGNVLKWIALIRRGAKYVVIREALTSSRLSDMHMLLEAPLSGTVGTLLTVVEAAAKDSVVARFIIRTLGHREVRDVYSD